VDGSYKIAKLAPGNYEVSASAPGFASMRISVTINADQDQVADLPLLPRSAPGTSSTVSGVLNSQTVRELPLNGRSASDLAALEPGVETARTQSSGQGKYGFGTHMTISGGRPRQNDARLKNNFVKRISDAFNVQIRAEFFNIINRANFAPPLDNRNLFDSAGNPIGNAGLITSTQTPSREIQFALKIIW
jgi:Carboxypeptidase regulatory-like domain